MRSMWNPYFFQRCIDPALHVLRHAFENVGVVRDDVIHGFVFCLGVHQGFICVLYARMCSENCDDLGIIIKRFKLGVNLLGRCYPE